MRKTIFRLALITTAVLLVAVSPAAAQMGTVVRVDPAFLQVAPGTEFTLTIQIDDVVNLYAFDIRVSFPPDKLELVSASRGDFLEGPFLGSITWDNYAGTVTAIVSQRDPAEPESGSGTLVVITFQAEAGHTLIAPVFIIPEARRSGTPPCAAFDRRSPFFHASAITTLAHHQPDRSSPDPAHDLNENLRYYWIAPDLCSTLTKYPCQYI